MAINIIVTDGTTGGINTNVVKVITQTTLNSDATVNADVNKGYILTSVTLQTVNLPTPCAVGDVFVLKGTGAGLFKVAQRAGEQLTLGNKTTTLGVAGFIDSTSIGDGVFFICTDASGKWINYDGYTGTFLIDGDTPTNTINNAASIASSQSLALGDLAAAVSQGQDSVAIGFQAARNNQSQNSVAVGALAATDNPGSNVVSLGFLAANTSQGNNSVAIGSLTASNSQGTDSVAIGFQACNTTPANNTVSVGSQAGQFSQGNSSIAVGFQAAQTTQGANSIAMGAGAAQTTQGTNSICLGFEAGKIGVVPNDSILMGSGCAVPGAVGRLAFGNSMEAVTAISGSTKSQSGYLNLEWNGTHYRIPAFSSSTTADITAATPAYGQMYMDFGLVSQALTQDAWIKWNSGTFNSGLLSDFTRTTRRLNYVGTETKRFAVYLHASLDDANSEHTYNGAIYKNGARVELSRVFFENSSGDGYTISTPLSLIELAENDFLEGYFRIIDTTDTLDLASFSITAIQIN